MGTHPIFESDFDCLTENMGKPKVAVIGAGPCGIFSSGAIGDTADVTIFERASVMGGQWAFSEEKLVELDRQHSSMYTCLWVNGPIEAFELPNHKFPDDSPSYIKRPAVYKYLQDYIDKFVKGTFKFSCKVQDVKFNADENNFNLTWEEAGETHSEIFDYVVVATGHFSVPNDPKFKGEETFTGKYIHAHDYRDGKLYKDLRVLLIGGSYSAEDIALQCWKYGSKYAHISHRNKTNMGYKWPEGIIERPILTNINGSTVTFADKKTEEYDVIIKCTGYLHQFPFMEEKLKLKTNNRFVPNDLYKQTVLINNNQVFYVGMQNQFFTMSMFQLQGFYIRDLINKKISLPNRDEMIKSYQIESEEESKLVTYEDMIRFQAKYVNMMADITNEDRCDSTDLLLNWLKHKEEDILGYRDKRCKNIFTGKLANAQPKRWIDDTEQ